MSTEPTLCAHCGRETFQGMCAGMTEPGTCCMRRDVDGNFTELAKAQTPTWIDRPQVLRLIDHYIKDFPDDAQVLRYLRDAVETGMEQYA